MTGLLKMENKLSFFFKHQIWHLGGIAILFYLSTQIVNFQNNTNTFIGIDASTWFIFSMSIPLAHQAYVWICWRSELCWKIISNSIGFKGYTIGFFILFLSRLSSIGLCIVDYGSLFKPGLLAWIVSLIIFIPAIYTFYSVEKYFGLKRATGADHFDSKYKEIPFEKGGIFQWSSNAMYVFGMAIFFGFAIATGSKAGLIFAIYSYASIWLHYFCTEKEDFKIIYENN
jgi:hypothetical protein